MISNLLKRIVYSSSPLVTLYDYLVGLDTRLVPLEQSNLRAGRGPIGQPFKWIGLNIPVGALILDGALIPRASYPKLFDELAPNISCTVTSGSTQVTGLPTLVVALLGGDGVKSPQIPVEGASVPAGTKIASILGTTLTLTTNAIAAGTGLRIFPFGNGDGSTTVNLPRLTAEYERNIDFARNVDPNRVLGSWQSDQVKLHQHWLPLTQNAGNAATPANIVNEIGALPMQSTALSTGANNYHTAWGCVHTGNGVDSSGGSVGSETRVRNVAVIPCIWAY